MIELRIADSVFEISKLTYQRLLSIGPLGSAALSFGSTYAKIFSDWKKILSAELLSEALRTSAGCSHLPSFFPADERLVRFDSPESNWGTLTRLFLSTCGNNKDGSRHPKSLEGYRKIISDFFPGPPLFDITFLGIGADGHTASLFPETCPDEEDEDWKEIILRTEAPFSPKQRLTLGPEVIADSRQLIIVVTGREKTPVLQRLFGELSRNGARDETKKLLPPVKIIKRREKLRLNTLILADSEAADGLTAEIKAEYTR